MSSYRSPEDDLIDGLDANRERSARSARSAGAAKAHQAVAQATAMAIQDATDSLRNMSTVSTVAVGTILSQLVETGDPKYLAALKEAQEIADTAAKTYGLIGRNASMVLGYFSTESDPPRQG